MRVLLPNDDEFKNIYILPPYTDYTMKEYTKDALIKHLRCIYEDRGKKVPGTIHLRNYKGPQYQIYVKLFGSWKNALEATGFNVAGRVFKKRM